MDAKKSHTELLEKNKRMFFQIGMIVVLACVLLAFEWKQYEKATKIDLGSKTNIEMIEEVIIQTAQEPPKPPVPLPQPQITILEIVNNDVQLTEEPFVNAEIDPNTIVREYLPPPGVLKEEVIDEQTIFKLAEVQPSFPGGEVARGKFFRDNIKYPQLARDIGIQGTVYVTFVVEPDGSVSGVEVLRGIGGGCDEEAVRVIMMMPKWNPGKQGEKSVRVQFNMPIKFTLQY